MKDRRLLPVVPAAPDAAREVPSGVSRRAALQSLAAGLGATLASAGVADAHPVQQHLAHAAAGQAPAAPPSGPFTPAFFDAHQFATLQTLGEQIVPGSQASGTAEFIDKLMTVESVDTRRRLITALGAMDGASLAAHQRPFKDLTPAQQTTLLTEASTLTPSRAPVYWKKGDPIPPPAPPPAPLNLRDHFEHIKGWVAGIHFSSEAGLKELGWTGLMFFEKFDACGQSA
ncbi:MAG: gluconate 2-dehydrogenase subunit 3 family protein [Vicinamibacteria bacterium]